MQFSGRRIRTPEQGLLAMHPFVDALEGRSLFTATLHAGVLHVEAVVDVPARAELTSPWSTQQIAPAAGPPDDEPRDLLEVTTPDVIELKPGTTGSAFADTMIGDTTRTLFGNALHDRRGRYDPQPLPSDDEIAEARHDLAATKGTASPFNTGRRLTGAMMPFLMMSVDATDHPFAE
jgi:hypothetical protein